MSNLGTESICIFGSAARASTDSLSDRDVLIVAETSNRRNELAGPWRQRGWSTALYSPRRLKSMVEARSLFIQHLKVEGIILEDNNGWLSDTLIAAEPKKSYVEDAFSSVSLALPMERLEGGDKISDCLIAADLGYTAVRNFGICYLADKNRLCFDYSDIIYHLSEDFKLSETEATLLQSLRAGKVAYRTRSECKNLIGSVEELRSLLTRFFLNRALGQIPGESPIRRLSGGYTMLRDFEASIMHKTGESRDKAELSVIGLDGMWRLIRDPREYSWKIRGLESTTLDGYKSATIESFRKLERHCETRSDERRQELPFGLIRHAHSLLSDGGRSL